MTDKKKIIKLTVIFIIITYVISGVGYFLWFGKTKAEAAAFIPILAPTIAGLSVYRKNFRRDFFKINIKGISLGIAIIVLLYMLAVIMFILSGKNLMKPQVNASDVGMLFVQWIFAGFCEELGWRGVMLPMLKKIFKLEKACLINGIAWAIWHLPLILTVNMSKGHSATGGFILFAVTTICLSYIFGLLSECKAVKSIWTYVTIHALYNIIGVILMSMITVEEYKFLDESGYYLVSALILITAGTYAVTLKSRRGHN